MGIYGCDYVITDPLPAADVFITGMFDIDNTGEFVRATFYNDRLTADGVTERMIVTRLVMTHECFDRCLRTAIGAMKHLEPTHKKFALS